jgi:thiosulfate/3-mercaptopyruvate sulfurtransferase
MTQTMTPVVSPDDVKDLLHDPMVRWVDARGGADAYERYRAAHLAQAVFLDLEKELSTKGEDAAFGGRHPLPDPKTFGFILGQYGITPATRVLVYDDKSGANAAARFWWMMKAAGHASVQVIDGGLTAIAEAGLPVSTCEGPPLMAAKAYPVYAWTLPVADIELVDKARTDGAWVVLDVREAYRYRGESEPIDQVAGHIPGAVNIPYLKNLETGGKFRSREALKEVYQGLTDHQNPKKIIVHCGSGVTACHTLLAFEHAGISKAYLYVGSWSEWSRNPKPVATGPDAEGIQNAV